MSLIDDFEREQVRIRDLDFQGNALNSEVMHQQFQRRNSFAVSPDAKIHRIFQKEFYEKDKREGYLTLPLASANIWNSPLENPLASIYATDEVTGGKIHYGSLVSKFYAHCWTYRSNAKADEWSKFSHGREPIRISTTVGKLMDRVMNVSDDAYMHRTWLIPVDYRDHQLIAAMKKPEAVLARIESPGALLAMSAAIVVNKCSIENEVRFLFDDSVLPKLLNVTRVKGEDGKPLLRLPFDWSGFVEKEESENDWWNS